MRPFFFLGLGLVATVALAGEPVRLMGGPARVALIELYTSEGCSSCPPADRWLSALCDAPGLWHDFVPLALHVDYWNRLGWPDRFSTRDYTARQRALAAAWGRDEVYTPCLVRDGREWRGARDVPNAGPKVGVLTASFDGALVRAAFVGAEAKGDLELHAAILGANVASRVTAGENAGETLRHDFVVLTLAHGALSAPLAIRVPPIAGVPRHALAVWVTRRGELVPLQAAGAWLD